MADFRRVGKVPSNTAESIDCVIGKVGAESAGCDVFSGSNVLFRYSVVPVVSRERPIPRLAHRSDGPVIQIVWYSGKRGKPRLRFHAIPQFHNVL